MPRQLIDVGGGKPLLDIASYARRGPGRRDRLSTEEIELIRRTVTRTPEVMVKVLTRGAQSLGAVRAHLAYLNRGGELEIETDQGDRLAAKGVERQLLEDWDLDLEEHRRRAELRPGRDRSPPKLVHKVLFSMPPGTPPDKVLKAVKNFAREEFGLKHRYAMVMHTDEPHPHVHMIIKTTSEQGQRLNIRKQTLRRWRAGFATHLRELGVPANATERAVRGRNEGSKSDGVFRAARRGDSWHVRQRAEAAASDVLQGRPIDCSGASRLRQTRNAVTTGWWAVSEVLHSQGYAGLAAEVTRFIHQLPPPRVERELLAERLRKQVNDARYNVMPPPVR